MNTMITIELNATQTESVFWRTLHRHASTPPEMLAWFYANVRPEPYLDELADNEMIPLQIFKATWYRVRDALVCGQMSPPAQMPLFAEATT
jgi:hypothetical protein